MIEIQYRHVHPRVRTSTGGSWMDGYYTNGVLVPWPENRGNGWYCYRSVRDHQHADVELDRAKIIGGPSFIFKLVIDP